MKAEPARAVLRAWAPRKPRPDWPWLLEQWEGEGERVVVFLEEPERGPLHARRARCARRVHASLASACQAYGIDAATDLEERWLG